MIIPGFCPPTLNNLASRSALAISDCTEVVAACGASKVESMKLAQPSATAMDNDAAIRVFFESFMMLGLIFIYVSYEDIFKKKYPQAIESFISKMLQNYIN